MEEPTHTKSVRLPCCSISATLAAVWVVITASIVVASCTLATSIVFSMHSLKDVAQGSARASFAHCNDRVVEFLQYPVSASRTQRFLATSTDLPVARPIVSAWNESEWYAPWQTAHLNMLANSNFELLFLATGFEDGQYVGCQTYESNDTMFSCLYQNLFDVRPSLGGSHFRRINYSRTDGTILSDETTGRLVYDVTARPWFISVNSSRSTKGAWSEVFFSSVPSTPVISFNSAVHSHSGVFLGASTFQLELSSIDASFKALLVGHVQQAFLLDNKNLLIASSLPKESFERRSIPHNYILTPQDISQNCVRSDLTILTQSGIVCQYSVDRYGSTALKGITEQWSDLFQSTETRAERTGQLTIKGETYYAMVSRLKGLGASYMDNMNWKLVVSLKENDAMPALLLGRNLAIGIAGGVLVILAIIVSTGMHFLLRPLSVVADLMGTAAYFSGEGETDTDNSAFGHEVVEDSQKVKAMKAHAALTKNRSASYLREVATIQQAYWAMSDELLRLKSYLPEHLLHEMTARKAPNPGAEYLVPESTKAGSPIEGQEGSHTEEAGALTAQTLQRLTQLDTNSKVALNWTTQPPSDFDRFSPASQIAPSTTSESGPKAEGAEASATRSTTTSGPTGPESVPALIFSGKMLAERNISISIVNIVQFHRYTQSKSKVEVMKEHADVVKHIHTIARKCGGVLETFMGDHFYVSFNSTLKCPFHAVAATCFSLAVSSTINSEALAAQHRLSTRRRNSEPLGLPPLGRIKSLFGAAPCGVTCGVATGNALVGPLGTNSVRRHSIISNAVTEAAALERMTIRYPNCSVFIGGDSIPEVEGYCQYMLLDATLLPASGGRRRRIASVKAGMCAEGCSPEALSGLGDLVEARGRKHNPYATINHAFNAFLEGRADDSSAAVREAALQIRGEAPLPEGALPLTREQCADINMMCELLSSFIASQVDGRVYRATVGDQYEPVEERILLDFTSPRNQSEGNPRL